MISRLAVPNLLYILGLFSYTHSMNLLLIYPTSRVLRAISEDLKEQDALLPTLMRMDEFEHRATLLPGKMMVDPLQRIIFLREAAGFEAFDTLNIDRELIRFFTKSDAVFKFFEELAQEGVGFDTLLEADAYAEFDTHLAVLEKLLTNYYTILNARGLTDKVFVPKSYQLNDGFIDGYDRFEIYLEGYLSRYELELIEKIAQRKPLIVHYATSQFNQKMQERFEAYGISLPQDSLLSFDLSRKEILSQEPNPGNIHVEVLQAEERYEQISIAFEKIEEFVRAGISPDSIVLILPDEDMKESFVLYDRYHNLNFAMGFDYSKTEAYKRVDALYGYWQHYDQESRYLSERYGLAVEDIDKHSSSQKCDIGSFFLLLDQLNLLDCSLCNAEERGEDFSVGDEQVFEKQLYFLKLFEGEMLSRRDWLFLWVKALSKITIDDVRGGKITVMGVLETRGVHFDAVVIIDFNEGIVPASSSKDQFLSSAVRTFASLPTLHDRESLQKQYYKRLLEQSKHAVILHCSSENRLPSKFLYELGIEEIDRVTAQLSLLYSEEGQLIEMVDPVVEDFDASAVVWSASRLKVYLECKRKYYYSYIQNIKAKSEDEPNEGALLHLLLDHLYRQRDRYHSADEMRSIISRVLDELLPQSDAKIAYLKLLWREKLKGFADAQIEHFEAGWHVVAREHEVSGEIGGLRFRGRIDRIDQDDTATLIIDYKSGSTKEANRVKNLENLSDFQMSIYDQLLAKNYQNITLAFMQILEGGRLEEIMMLEEKSRLLAEHIAELKQTKQFTASRCENLQKCKYCEFALMCERGEYL
ncbi:MAG: PD-(D/E)XK nuclease family protein [Campylobacterota bacterium]|nr:PD-(D/E)XK nuclease family protein [Campylobacterota bacterium]